MTGRDKFLTALSGGEPDRIPIWELIIDRPVIEALEGDISREDFIERYDLDGITIFQDMHKVREFDAQTYEDEWGITWRVGAAGISYPLDGPIKSEKDLDNFRHPDPDADYRLDTLRRAVSRFKGKRAVVFLGHETFEFSHYLLGGMDKLFLAYIENPDFVDRLSGIIWDYNERLFKNAARAGADVLLSGDDYAGRLGTFMSPTHFRRFILPYLKRTVDVAKSAGLPFIKHTDGNLWEVMADIVGAGISGLCPLEPIAHMDIGEVKRRYGDRICLAGNIDCTGVLPRGTEEDVTLAVKETIAKAGPNGGFILSSSNSIHPGVKPENYLAMLKAAREFGNYPLDEKMVAEYKNKNYVERFLD